MSNFQHKVDLNHAYLSGLLEQYGLNLKDFSAMVERLEKTFKFSFEPSLFTSKNPPGKINMLHQYVSFIYYCNALDVVGIDVDNLVRQFKNAQNTAKGDFREIRHAASLARLGFILHAKDHTVIFPSRINGSKNPDLKVDNLDAELKVYLDDFLHEADGYKRRNLIIKDQAVSIDETIKERIRYFLHTRENEAFQQGQLLFADCTDVPLFGILQLNFNSVENIPKPAIGKVIVYKTTHYMPGITVCFKNTKCKESSFTPEAPYLDYFWGVYKEEVLGSEGVSRGTPQEDGK